GVELATEPLTHRTPGCCEDPDPGRRQQDRRSRFSQDPTSGCKASCTKAQELSVALSHEINVIAAAPSGGAKRRFSFTCREMASAASVCL
ncbi:hypothetical protein D4764_05G0012790, partial [Takifugu flavidus]